MPPASVRLGVLAGLGLLGASYLRRRVDRMTVVGHSMAPALRHRQRVWLWRTRPGYRYEVGQVVAFEHARGHGRPPLLVKRIVELGGGDDSASTVPPGHVRVLGDGRMSLDSRQLGPIPEASIRGVVVSRWS